MNKRMRIVTICSGLMFVLFACQPAVKQAETTASEKVTIAETKTSYAYSE